jgi:hypothetical protein
MGRLSSFDTLTAAAAATSPALTQEKTKVAGGDEIVWPRTTVSRKGFMIQEEEYYTGSLVLTTAWPRAHE